MGATVGLYLERSASGTQFALDATGTVSLTGWSDVSLAGTIRARVNGFTDPVNEVVVFGDGSGDVTIAFTAGEGDAYAGTGLTLTVLGQSLSADLAFVKTGTGYTVTAKNVSLRFGDATGTAATFTGCAPVSCTITMADGEVTAALAGTLAITVPGVAFEAALSLEVSTAAADRHLRVSGTLSLIHI